ncbi:hypothetical protein CJ263_06415 [Maribacter cobaltidurans]|uniref:Polyketide cyclase/dehydrase n=2 Tax=Maribacter cobaltidurans TaxID=1178778 RepID=A0A223V382_9FLAO|nr:hypothetical protein CJ263_06415 [Maribacter cobaltidurans]
MIATFFIYEQFEYDTNRTRNKNIGDMNIPINKNAPVQSSFNIYIDAPKEKVWGLLTNINDWPNWQSDITQAILNQDLGEGVAFKWKAGGLSFNSQIHTMIPEEKLGWTGNTIGAKAIHNWFLSSAGKGTEVYVEESLQGVFPNLFTGYFQKNLDKGVQKNLMELKLVSEK